MVAVFSNARTAVCAKKLGEAGWTASFNCAFRAVRPLPLPPFCIHLLLCCCFCRRNVSVSNSTHSDRTVKPTSIGEFCDAQSTKSLPKHTDNIFLVFGDNFFVVERSAAF